MDKEKLDMVLNDPKLSRIAANVRDNISYLGESINREGLRETPARVALMYNEIFGGYDVDVQKILSTAFEDGACDDMVIVQDIPFYSHCEHHMVPFFGHAHVAYIPNGKIIGLSKIARVVDAYARRLQVQERLTSQIADALNEALDPLGVMVVIQAEHLCMAMRGIKKPGTNTVTSSCSGVFRDNYNNARAEFLGLLRLGGK